MVILINYYWTLYFILPFIWLINVAVLLIIFIIQFSKLIKERKNISNKRIMNVTITFLLLFLTFYRFYEIPNIIIEKMDWIVLKNKRISIVEKVKLGQLKPNVKWNNGICELPFEFPVVSNGGNDIWIFTNKNTDQKTIKFFIFRNFFDSPSTFLIYSNDNDKIKYYEQKIKNNPRNNWKIEDNWYRIVGN